VFRLGALVNWAVTAPAIAAPAHAACLLGLAPIDERLLFLLRIWAGMAFLWGCMFWEISRDLRARKHMIKYTWIEKSITAISVTHALRNYCAAGALIQCIRSEYARCFLLVVFTDWLWIPLFLYYDAITRGNDTPEHALASARLTLGLSSERGH
jgi:hypothetical protein